MRIRRYATLDPLAYPAGRAPGFDSNHVAARNGRPKANLTSVLALPGKQVGFSVLGTSGKATLASGTGETAVFDGIIGPALNHVQATSTNDWTTSSQASGTTPVMTFGAIFTSTGAQIANGAILGIDVGTFLGFDASNNVVLNDDNLAVVSSSAIAVVSGHSYFVGASCNPTKQNFVVVDLKTGQMKTATGASAFSATVTFNGVFFLVQTAGTPSGGNYKLAAAMMNGGAMLSLADLVTWGADPWAFWVPRSSSYDNHFSSGAVTAFSISIGAGTYALTNESETLLAARKEFPQSGSYALTDEAETLKRGSQIAASSGSYSLTDESLTFKATRLLGAQAAAFALTDENEQLLASRKDNVQAGFYALTDETLSLSHGYKVSANAGFYALTDESLTMRRTALLNASVTTFSLTDEQLTLLAARKALVNAGFYALTDEAETLKRGSLVSANAGFYSLTDEQLTLKRKALLNAQAGFYALTVESLTLVFSGTGAFAMTIGTGTYALSDEQITLLAGRLDKPQAGIYALTDEAEVLKRGALIAAQAGFYNVNPGIDLARSFNGSSDFITFNDASLPSAGGNRTVSLWFKSTTVGGGDKTMLAWGTSSSNEAVFLYLTNGAVGVDSFGTVWYDNLGGWNDGNWHHVAFTYSSPTSSIYVDGNAHGTNASNAFNTILTGSALIANDSFGTRKFTGQLTDIAIWNSVLTTTQIANLAAGQRANTIGANANLVHYEPILGQSPEPDKSGNGNNGTLTGTSIVAGPPTLQPFGVDLARSFNGSSDFINTGARQMPQSAFTCAAWISASASPSVNGIIAAAYNQPGPNAYFQFAYLTDGTLFARIQQSIDTIYIQRTSNTGVIPFDGSWHHVAMTWNGGTTDAAIKSYFDGVEADTTSGGAGSFTGPYAGSAAEFWIGAQHSNAGVNDPFKGSIADIGTWNIALTGAQIASLASGSRADTIASGNSVGDWPVLGQSPEPDASGNDNSGVLTGTSLVGGPPNLQPYRSGRAGNETLLWDHLIKGQTGSYTLTIESLSLVFSGTGSFTISIATGTYALTDEQLTLLKTSKENIQAGAYALTDENEKLLWKHSENIQTGFYGPGSNFDPVSLITGGGGFWRADMGVTLSGSAVTAWADQSAFGNTLTQVGTTQTFSSTGFNSAKPGITFVSNSGNGLLNSSVTFPATTTFSIFFLLQKAAGGSNFLRYGALETAGNNDFTAPSFNAAEDNAGNNQYAGAVGATIVGNGGSRFSLTTNGLYLIGNTLDGANANLWVNGAAQGAATSFSSSVGGAGSNTISCGPVAGLTPAGMTVAFFGMTQKAMTSTDWANLAAWANANWGTSFSVSGSSSGEPPLALLKASKLFDQTGFYSLAGENEALKATRRVSSQTGFYALAGEQISEKAGKLAIAQAGFYSLAGEQITLKAKRLAGLQTVFYNLTGEALSISIPGQFVMSISPGTYSLAGENEALLKASKALIFAGNYTFTGENEKLLRGAFAIPFTGFYNVTDEQLKFIKTSKLAAQTATYTLAIENEQLLKGYQAAVQSGFYTLTGKQISDAILGFAMTLGAGKYLVTGEVLSITSTAVVIQLVAQTILLGRAAAPALTGTESSGTLLGRDSAPSVKGTDANATLLGVDAQASKKGQIG